MKGDMRTWGRRLIQHCYNTCLKEQNIFKNPYKFFIICYTFRDNIYNKGKGGREEREIYGKSLHKPRRLIRQGSRVHSPTGLPWNE